MLRFENEIWFWGMILVPILALLFIFVATWRKKAIARTGDEALIRRLSSGYSPRRQRVKTALYLLAIFFLIIGLANPQVGTKLEKVKRQGVDVIIAIDVSRSMLAEDIQPNRLERSKQLVSRMIDNMKGDRVGLIVFAGNAYLQMPLTIDYAAAKLFLKSVSTGMVPTQGTSIGDALDLAINNFDRDQRYAKALLLITDGENHEQGAIDLAEKAKENGIVIHTLGVGSEEGTRIPEYNQRGQRAGWKQDKNGQEIVSKLNEAFLQEIAEITDGDYMRLKGDRKEVGAILSQLDNMEKKDFEDRVFTDYEDQFQYFVFIAIFLIIIEILISGRSAGWFKNWSLFSAKKKEDELKPTITK